ncbi:MAG: hypothetical protein ACRC9T_08145 [Vibrionaceae bacterium]
MPASQDDDLGGASASIAAEFLSSEAELFSVLKKEQQRLESEQQEYESALRRGQSSKAALEAPISAYRAAIHEQAQRYLLGGGLSASEKAQLIAELVQTLQPILEDAARKGGQAKVSQAELYAQVIAKQMAIEEDAKEVQEFVEAEVEELEILQRLKFTEQSDKLSQSLINKAASRIANIMAKRVNLKVTDKVLEPMSEAVIVILQQALQEKYGLLLEEKAEHKIRTEQVQWLKFKAEEFEKRLVAGKPELALMAENRYELEQKRDARAEVLRQGLKAKQVKFDAEIAQLRQQQQQCVAEGKEKKSQNLLLRIEKMKAGRIDIDAEILADRTIKNLNKEIAAVTKAMEKRALSIPALTLQQDALLRTQLLADQLRGAAAAEEPHLAELHAAAEPQLAQARLYHEAAQAIKGFDNVKVKFSKS